ncbi:hypothetical protein ECDEC6E_1103 [Escherichia coli DEC6E]|nr:Hypothetical protein FORC43_3224 [Escherichia coli]EHV62270.1 hypothetical protein ECDEC6B_1421 [Escherichia coli DEC6B]EHV77481.1 hypothetical protein ECDEC6E_1103 [Escherichia coli DEC6E]KDA76105.1 hypothetical protein AC13_5660 [Escherichia coli 2-011-08_S3_C2]KDW71376.1 hypothetical protein AC65_4228 [Escherichia coli 2-005-03_S4_C1]KDX03836.1 hypothetical protein AD27_5188 [Escherichia coli 2-177-06_S4_C3]KDY14843.1 hypothetical protein AD00_4189 [Escherichia coli 2-316-03_S4_C2]KDZ1
MDSEQSRTKNTGRRLIIFLVRLVRPAENVAVQKGVARKQHLSVCQSTSWISGGGGGRVSVPLLIPALVLPEDTLADTHLKKPANAVESSVSRDTTLSVSCFKCSWPALGPTAQAMMDPNPRPRIAFTASPYARASEGVPSVIRNTRGRQSPLVSPSERRTSRSTHCIRHSRAAPVNVPPALGTTMSENWKSSSGVRGMNSRASLS